MKTTNSLLAIIAACLVFQTTRQFVGNPTQVEVKNTVDVDVKGLNGHTMTSSFQSAGHGADGFPVVILNQ